MKTIIKAARQHIFTRTRKGETPNVLCVIPRNMRADKRARLEPVLLELEKTLTGK